MYLPAIASTCTLTSRAKSFSNCWRSMSFSAEIISSKLSSGNSESPVHRRRVGFGAAVDLGVPGCELTIQHPGGPYGQDCAACQHHQHCRDESHEPTNPGRRV